MSTKSIYKSLTGERAIMARYDTLLARWPVPCTTLEVDSRYGTTFVIASGNESAILIGLSQGGWTALKFATSRPERVDKLVLLTPGGITPDRISFALRAIPLSFMGRWGIERINRMVFGPQPIPAEVNETTTLIMTHFRVRIGVLPIFSDEQLQRLTMPTLLLIGQEDALRDARKIADRMRKLVPELTAKIIPHAGHAMYNTPSHIIPFLAANGGR